MTTIESILNEMEARRETINIKMAAKNKDVPAGRVEIYYAAFNDVPRLISALRKAIQCIERTALDTISEDCSLQEFITAARHDRHEAACFLNEIKKVLSGESE